MWKWLFLFLPSSIHSWLRFCMSYWFPAYYYSWMLTQRFCTTAKTRMRVCQLGLRMWYRVLFWISFFGSATLCRHAFSKSLYPVEKHCFELEVLFGYVWETLINGILRTDMVWNQQPVSQGGMEGGATLLCSPHTNTSGQVSVCELEHCCADAWCLSFQRLAWPSCQPGGSLQRAHTLRGVSTARVTLSLFMWFLEYNAFCVEEPSVWHLGGAVHHTVWGRFPRLAMCSSCRLKNTKTQKHQGFVSSDDFFQPSWVVVVINLEQWFCIFSLNPLVF